MTSRPPPVFLPALWQDLREIVTWTDLHFGPIAANRCSTLIRQALQDLHADPQRPGTADPQRPGTKARPDLAPNAYTYHLLFSRDRVAGEVVKTPRHFVLYRSVDTEVEFARLLHDSRDLVHHLPTIFRGDG